MDIYCNLAWSTNSSPFVHNRSFRPVSMRIFHTFLSLFWLFFFLCSFFCHFILSGLHHTPELIWYAARQRNRHNLKNRLPIHYQALLAVGFGCVLQIGGKEANFRPTGVAAGSKRQCSSLQPKNKTKTTKTPHRTHTHTHSVRTKSEKRARHISLSSNWVRS